MNIPVITKEDVLNSKRFEATVHRLVAGQFFRDANQAKVFLGDVKKFVEATLRDSPEDSDVVTEHMRIRLRESWDEINLGYDRTTGRVVPAFASTFERKNLPPSIYEEAYRRVQNGQMPTFEAALEAVCTELRTPMPSVARAVLSMMEVEPDLLKEEEAARLRLKEATAKVEALRNGAIAVLAGRDDLAARVERHRAELSETESKRSIIASRRSRALTDVGRHLRKGITIPWQPLIESGAAVAGFDIALQELDRLIVDQAAALAKVEKEQVDYLAAHSSDLELVTRS